MGSKCHDCGYNDRPDVLEFHHIIPRYISGRESMTIWIDRKFEAIEKEVKGHCLLLCPNCHRIRHKDMNNTEEK